MQINFWCIHKHFHANWPVNFANQTTSIELGINTIALPIIRVIAVSEDLDILATVTLLKAEKLTLVSVRLDLSQTLRRA